jgi:hypothetical protein
MQSALQDAIEKTTDESRSLVFDKLDTIQGQIIDSQSDVKNEILLGLKENISIMKDDYDSSMQSALQDAIEKTTDESRSLVFDKLDTIQGQIIDSQSDVKDEIFNKITKANEGTELLILNELGENINLVKEVLISLTPDKELVENIFQKTLTLQDFIKEVSTGIENKIFELEEDYKLSTQLLLSDIKASFDEKLEDNIDELKSFIELVDDKRDFLTDLDGLKYTLIDKFSEISDRVENSISSINVNEELKILSEEVKNTADALLLGLEEKITESIKNSDSINKLTITNEEISKRIENLKNIISEEFTEKFNLLELSIDTQKQDFVILTDEVKSSLNELSEKYTDLSLNSITEISEFLISIQEKINSLQNTIETLNFSNQLTLIENKLSKLDVSEKIEKIDEKLSNFNFENIESKLNELNFNEILEDSKNEMGKEFSIINQKLDLLAIDSNSDVEDNIEEIKQLLESQANLMLKLDNLEKIENIPTGTDLETIKSNIQNVMKNFEDKLDTSLSKIKTGDKSINISNELDKFKEDLLNHLIEIFSQISFVTEAEEIKEFIEENNQKVKENIQKSLESNFNDILSSLDVLHETTNSVKKNLGVIKGAPGIESEDSYTFQDIESDIAKVRLILQEIAQSKGIDDLDKLHENIMSISSRTNKILLNSDESNNVLLSNLDNLKTAVATFEDKIKRIDNKELLNTLENINRLMLSSVKSDKTFNQAFMYLAEWIDNTSENLETMSKKISEVDTVKQSIIELKKVLPKTIAVEKTLDKISKKFDKQQEKINSLENKIEQLIKENKTKQVDADIKSIITEVLNQVKMPEVITDTKLTKKVDNIDKKLIELGQNIEKITSYVD